MSLGNLKKLAKIQSLNNFEINFEIYEINHEQEDLVLSNEIYEFEIYDLVFLRVKPCGAINIDRSKDSVSLRFPIFFIDLQIKKKININSFLIKNENYTYRN